jgi:hypothetical protein
MRWWLLVIAFAACARSSSGPAWPKSNAVAGDGESLAPRPSARAIAAPDADDEVAVVATPAAAAKPAAAAPTEAAPAATTPTEDPITTEEITIEIDDE